MNTAALEVRPRRGPESSPGLTRAEVEALCIRFRPEVFWRRFWERVAIGPPGACWEWRGALNRRGGYGIVAFGRGGSKRLLAHRVAYVYRNGPLRPGKEAMHSCDNPPCCNPQHLKQGAHITNMRDRDERGRDRWGRARLVPMPAALRHAAPSARSAGVRL